MTKLEEAVQVFLQATDTQGLPPEVRSLEYQIRRCPSNLYGWLLHGPGRPAGARCVELLLQIWNCTNHRKVPPDIVARLNNVLDRSPWKWSFKVHDPATWDDYREMVHDYFKEA